MRAIAFAYADAIKRLSPIYRGIAEDLIKNVHEVMPGVPVFHLSAPGTERIPGTETIEVPMDVPLMTWRLKCHAAGMRLADEVLFTEPDVRFKADVLHVFDDTGFDVAVTDREVDSDWNLGGEIVKLSQVAHYTLGTTFSRSTSFWEECADYCATLAPKEQNWLGDMLALAHVIDAGRYQVKTLPGPIYNHVPCSREDSCEAKVLHYKGMRKEWLFPGLVEA